MKKLLLALSLNLAMGVASADTVKVGLIAPFSGPSAEYGEQFRRGMHLYLDQIGGKVGDVTVQIIDRDEEGGAARVKQVAQELILQDEVQFLAGLEKTPDALALAPLINKSKTPTVILNAATGVIPRKSPYFARVSFTQFQGAATLGEWAAKNGISTVYTAVTDYAPGNDSREAFKTTFTKGGGKIVGETQMPIATTDFAPYLQKIKDTKPDAVFMFTPYGAAGVSFIKTFFQMGLGEAGIKLLATGETNEADLPAIGNVAEGTVTAFHYSPLQDNAVNRRFVDDYRKKYGERAVPNFATVAGYDGMHAIADVVSQLGANIDGDKAMEILRNWKADSPRGAIFIDPEERDIIQDIAIRRVQKMPDGSLANVEFERVEQVKDLWKVMNPQ
ncbi:ABC transporter substrate-binding protein [Pusillimonas sp. CC-YST705]|uniref:ABC transporter substrate-binding protein n=1 Tax=Mesopusillimonas faecipullorum TaxID=2755040 RepID=A0ABS8C955_9BURK|nr:ABC transporter substrate-binding protein [Mesopusillimonas faecipullorum]MCB5362561.1 ABC transporter substrate-binding protein [Mesopusillimonas faecipullorum]